MTQATYRLYCKVGYFDLATDGTILYDSSRDYYPDSGEWRVLGFGTRFNSRHVVPLAEAADGATIGHGFVHDMDHGTHRTWMMPRDRRAVSVKRLQEERVQ